MNAKELKKYDLIIQIGNALPEESGLVGLFTELANNDFQTAVEMWEYKMTMHVTELSHMATAKNLESAVWDALANKSDARLKQLLADSAPLQKLIYTNSATVATGANLTYLTQLILASKIEPASEILRLVAANKNVDFGDSFKIILDDVFKTYCQKSGTAVPSLNRKQTMMLLEFALKIKGPNKNLLVQRIKELG
ncbi:MAG: hypothetical protein FWE38_01090 [Firmicutes bacterium]|nr:hypothetical protein [Bacillota bacterium]